MRVYAVYADPLSPADDRDAVFVREGFSWPAALFTVLWALYHGLWGWAAILFAAAGALAAGGDWLGLGASGQAVIVLGYLVLVGHHANDWRCARLVRRGRVFAGLAAGRTLAAAEQRLLDRWAHAAR